MITVIWSTGLKMEIPGTGSDSTPTDNLTVAETVYALSSALQICYAIFAVAVAAFAAGECHMSGIN